MEEEAGSDCEAGNREQLVNRRNGAQSERGRMIPLLVIPRQSLRN